MRDYEKWHERYDNPSGSLAQRLAVVQHWIGHALDHVDALSPRVLSLCAGDGRDLIPVLAARPTADARATLVEIDAALAGGARQRADEAGLTGVQVITGDAGSPATFDQALPVDLLLLCGIFGNVSDDDIRATVDATPALLNPGGFVIWTRGWFADQPDLRPRIRNWFVEAALTEVAFHTEPTSYGVGVARRPRRPDGQAPGTAHLDASDRPDRLFTFIR